jgi:hypothetical protein
MFLLGLLILGIRLYDRTLVLTLIVGILVHMNPVASPPKKPLRSPKTVMHLDRMGCFHQTRLSFMRALLRYLKDAQWRFELVIWEVDDKGVGIAVYAAHGPERTYSLICYANDLDPEKRSDRVIATEWDAAFTLFDGVPDRDDIERLRAHVPKQEAGHCSQSELVLARANRSVRLFEHVVSSLAEGKQPNQEMIDSVGYLMRTTAVYGNGKFGISDRERISDRPEFKAAFRAELLAVWLIRQFTVDIVQHMAQVRGGNKAVKMHPDLSRRLGVGNSTGLGMAPFLILHPALIHSWMLARETALARVRSIEQADSEKQAVFSELISRMMLGVESWNTADQRQAERIQNLKKDLFKLMHYVRSPGLKLQYPWDQLVSWSEQELSIEGQELVVTLVIEPHGELVDDLADTMAIDEAQYFPVNGEHRVCDVILMIENEYSWALEFNYQDPAQCARFWYVSEEKLEPRVGERFDEPGAEKEHPLSYGRDVAALHADLTSYLANSDESEELSGFLLHHPQHRHAVRRIQIAERLPYAEIQDNLLSAEMVPVDLLRCKLSFFGANKFDPKSDRWVRINMYQHAPFPVEFASFETDDWIYPPLLP